MRVLLTGAAGFFGSRAAMHLAREGHEVHGVDLPTAGRARLEALAPEVALHLVNLEDADRTRAMVCDVRPDVAVHLAWYAVPGKYLSAPENLACLTSSLNLFGALVEAGTKRLVTAGTCFEYAMVEPALVNGAPTWQPFAEDAPTGPRFLYSACKLALGEVLREAGRARGVQHCHARFFYQYGPWEAPGRVVPAVVTALLGGEEAKVTSGEQIRDFLHIEDVARAIVFAATSTVEGVLNVGSGIPVRVRDVVAACAQACGREDLVRYGALPSRPGDPPFVCAKVEKLQSLGWSPRWSLEDGVADTVAWYRGALP